MRAVLNDMPPRWQAERENAPDAHRDEMWEGVRHVPPIANEAHQTFAGRLYMYLTLRWGDPLGNRVHLERNVAPPDEPDWRNNYRIPDLNLLSPDRFGIERGSHLAGAPLVVVELRSPDDETYDKFPFYADLGVPEVWVFDRDTKAPEVYALDAGTYRRLAADPDGWLGSPATGVEFRHDTPGFVRVRVAGDDGTAQRLPNG